MPAGNSRALLSTMSTFEIDVAKSELSFAAGHFITYGGGRCERLHGHNYRVGVRISGELNEDGLVYDFVALKRRVSALVADLDHKMLVQTENRTLGVDVDDRIHVTDRDAADCGYRNGTPSDPRYWDRRRCTHHSQVQA